MNWAVAHRIAGIAASQAHRDLGIDRTRYVPVHQALKRADLVGMAQPMPRLFGVYVSPADNGPAVLLNANLNIVTQRHTAAHELGHHQLGHHSAADDDLSPALRWGNGSWPDEEKTAEAFAAWFLMPRPAVLAGLDRICQGQPTSPEHVYRLARELGTSYTGTVRQMQNLRLLEADRARQWAKISPAALRSSLVGGAALPADAHVHVVAAASPLQQVHADVGDVLIVQEERASFVSLPKGLVHWTDAGQAVEAVMVTDEFCGSAVLEVSASGLDEPIQLMVVRDAPRAGVHDVWPD
ncbi:ImmA/IrrE family metallo-endopeptidase [Streptomyces sp. Amel2xC10]|uniref:ImmA/IrrE family metallo-endopeptidase n=1 Tax=Streptomyces sp. Amel2xC10 TaxID=1305826 RepID=UPI000A0864E1|nr:ImmA/IrrE family metallo-endopeptidase [Streptomyces sp. Amel2xC10]SMF86235.1 Predicted Zn peptidase [Streptomyces sp. Amel2xC10]